MYVFHDGFLTEPRLDHPEGVAVHPDGLLYVGCYEPSQVVRIGPGGEVAMVAHDPTAHLLCHPTTWPSAPTVS